MGRAVLGVLVVVCGGVTMLAVGLADRLIFVPPPASYGADAPGLIRLPTARGDTVAAVYHRGAPGAPTVLFAHGNAEDLGDLAPFLARYQALGVSVVSFDYPGYGLSTGRPSERGSYAAADAVYDFLVSQGVSPRLLVVHGRSLGGGVMVDLAARQAVGGLVIESSFVSAYRVMTRWPVLPIDQFTSLKKLGDVSAPVLVIHGTRDEVIAPWHGRRLAEAVPAGRRRALWVEGAGHNDLVATAREAYWRELRTFFGTMRAMSADGP
jgi:fermentation-respiration switch protein FrsA (DUF1100 family)